MSGVATTRSKSDLTVLHLLHQILSAHHVGTGGLGFVGLGAAGEDADAHGATGAIGEIDHAAHHLVGMLGIDAQIHGDFDGLVELRAGRALNQLHRLFQGINRVAVESLVRLANAFSFACHGLTPSPRYPWSAPNP